MVLCCWLILPVHSLLFLLLSLCFYWGWFSSEKNLIYESDFIFLCSFSNMNILFCLVRYGYMQRSGNCILGSWWDMVSSLPTTLYGCGGMVYFRWQLCNRSWCVCSTNEGHKCPWVLDGNRRSWTMMVKLDYELVAIWILGQQSLCGRNILNQPANKAYCLNINVISWLLVSKAICWPFQKVLTLDLIIRAFS